MALREVADNIEEDAIAQQSQGVDHNAAYFNIQERVLVCVSTYPNSLQLLRRGSRLANYMHAPLFVLFVDDPDRFLTKAESLHVETCEKLCRDFEGEFIHLSHHNKAQTIAETASKYRITQIVMGESQKSRWQILLRGSLTQQLLKLIKGVDVHIISTNKSGIPSPT